jgi:orotidine-5'-phosphate decarboxylase
VNSLSPGFANGWLKNPLCLSLDIDDRSRGLSLVQTLGPLVGMVKTGPIPYLSFGPDLLEVTEKAGISVFLDLKWHDIPNTVHDVIASIPSRSIRMITVHSLGGPSMISAARRACDSLGENRPLLVAVTALTHLSREELHQIGLPDRKETVARLGSMALDYGADGLVLSPGELPEARDLWGEKPFLVTPGIRFSDSSIEGDDQHFSDTPSEAIRKGSNLLVVGRPILRSPNPIQTVRKILSEINRS